MNPDSSMADDDDIVLEKDDIVLERYVDEAEFVTPAEIAREQTPATAGTDAHATAGFPDVAEDVAKLAHTHKLGAANYGRRLVYALIARTITEYKADPILVAVSYMAIPFLIAFGAAAGFAVSAGLLWCLAVVNAEWLYAVLLGFVVIIWGKSERDGLTMKPVSLHKDIGKADYFKLGRLDGVFGVANAASNGFFFGIFFGGQMALLYLLPNHGGLDIEGTLTECLLLTIDNLCHGLFFDSFELYNLRFGTKITHTTFSATIFFVFRITYAALFLVMGHAIWKRYRMGWLFLSSGYNERDVSGVLEWINLRLGDGHHWTSRYPDEFIFLLLSKVYIEGNDEFVRTLAASLPDLAIENEVRVLFVDDLGQPLLPKLVD